MKGKQTNKHQVNTARADGLVWMSRQCTVITGQPASHHISILMGPNQNEHRRLFTSSPRNQDPVHLLDDDLRRDLEQHQERQQQTYRRQVKQHQQQQLANEQQQQQGLGEGADIQIVGVVPGTNEEQEVRNWKLFAGNVRW